MIDARRVFAIALLAVSSVCLLPAVASARSAARPPATRGSTYLALGDSVTFGFEEGTVVPAPNYHNPRSFVAYPELAGRELRLKVVNAGCAGETSASFISTSAQSNGCENSLGSKTGYRTKYPLHVGYRGSQLAFALSYLRSHRRVRLVSLMIGANDVFLCEHTTKDFCLSRSEQQSVFAKVSANVKRIVSAIRKRARYRGQLVIVNYYSLNYASSLINAGSRGLNSAQDSAARPYGIKVADGFGTLQAATRIFGGDTCAAGLLTRLSSGHCGVHPTRAGHSLLAYALVRAIRF